MSTRLALLLIKPSHYDDRGYPITWARGLVPSNSLAVMNGLAADCAGRQVLGPEVAITVATIDEVNQTVDPRRLIRQIGESGCKTLVMLVGVQTNQFPRALDIARPLRAAGIPVMIGGFHVSGTLSMLPEPPAELHEAWAMGVSLFAGEAEDGRLDTVLRDAWAGNLKPLYNHLDDLPGLAGAPTPILPAEAVRRTFKTWSSFDLGRGCPFQCSFCTIINVQGRKSRFRTADDLERIVRGNHAQGIRGFFITDDNLVRNHDWESFFDRLIELRAQDIKANLTIQVDTLCHRVPGFIEKAVAAGVIRVFIGLENINPDNLLAIGKRQNRITEYRAMLQEWIVRGVYTFAGYIIGFPADTPESVLRDVDIIKRELPITVLEFFYLTPLPGSKDHADLVAAGGWIDPDLNKYDLHHIVSRHPVMSTAEWEAAYKAAWQSFFSWEHMETVARRHGCQPAGTAAKAMQYFAEFKLLYEIEGVHPLDGGVFRIRARRQRRAGLGREWAPLFYLRELGGIVRKAARLWLALRKLRAVTRRIEQDPARRAYADIALQRGGEGDEALALFRETRGGERAVATARAREERVRRAGLVS